MKHQDNCEPRGRFTTYLRCAVGFFPPHAAAGVFHLAVPGAVTHTPVWGQPSGERRVRTRGRVRALEGLCFLPLASEIGFH